ncbi:phosducin-like protein [Eriocheir sinensis]|uniref:phosducin-like protein n=1 Tax=Eriocheir sinensis TaxID=95602 RepID=UPI0021C98F29|nr:phosducin-like protein [Eriocheir sinensis]
MATLDDRLLGEKLHYYCSSSEDEDEEEEEEEEGEGAARGGARDEVMPPPPPNQSWEGSSTNTGPKGVLKDWQRFKQLEAEQRVEQERERILLTKKLAMTCRSNLDDEKDKAEQKKKEEEEDEEALLDEAFLRQYISRRMEEMVARTTKRFTFGRLVHLESREAFLDAIDKEDKEVTVIIHIFEKGVPGCTAMTGCLGCLAQDYPHVKFCTMPASVAGVSANFKAGGCPALLVYKAGQLVGNFVRLTDEFSDDFYATDVESFLVEHGILVDRSLVPPGIRGPADDNSDDEDGGGSDFSLDN